MKIRLEMNEVKSIICDYLNKKGNLGKPSEVKFVLNNKKQSISVDVIYEEK